MRTVINIVILVLFNFALAQDIACVGNSITKNGYPEILEVLLIDNGYNYKVYNYGVPGAGVISTPYKETIEYNQVLNLKPQHIIVMLGTNDWYQYSVQTSASHDLWESEYRYLINQFKKRSRVFIGTVTYRTTESNANAWIAEINNLIKNAAADNNLKIIDFCVALGTNPDYFKEDGIHPSSEGKRELANCAYNILKNYPIYPPTVLPYPLNFKAIYVPDDKCIHLIWNAVDKAQSYRINRSFINPDTKQWVHTWYPNITSLEYIDNDLKSTMTYFYSVQAFLNGIYGDRSSVKMITTGILDCSTNTLNSKNFNLEQNHPNPFNPSTTIQYVLLEESTVNINVFDMLGIEINQLISLKQPSGVHSIQWNGLDQWSNPVGAGIYFYQLQTGDFVQTKKMVLMK